MPERPAAFDTTLFRVTVRRVLLVAASFTLALFGWFLLDERDALNAQEKSSVAHRVLEPSTEVVAEVDGRPITRADLELAVGAELAELERRQNQLYHQALQQKIDDLLLEAEARKRGVAADRLVASSGRAELLAQLRQGAEVRILGEKLTPPAPR